MPVSKSFLAFMRCPVTGQPLAATESTIIQKLNVAIAAKEIVNRLGEQVTEPIEAGLTNQDQSYLFPIRGDIVTMISDDLIELNQL